LLNRLPVGELRQQAVDTGAKSSFGARLAKVPNPIDDRRRRHTVLRVPEDRLLEPLEPRGVARLDRQPRTVETDPGRPFTVRGLGEHPVVEGTRFVVATELAQHPGLHEPRFVAVLGAHRIARGLLVELRRIVVAPRGRSPSPAVE
jgi:hypothetical protein